MIPIKKEPEMLYNEFGVYEKCVFCKQGTKTWHIETNNAVCNDCAKIHNVSELKNHYKNEIK